MVQMLLPLFPKEVTDINEYLSFCMRDDRVYYFYGSGVPIFHHHKDDHDSFDMINAQFYADGKATQMDICRAFGISEIRMKRAAKIYRDEGIHGFYKRRSKSREAYVLKPEIVEKAEELLSQGKDPKDIASQLELKYNTLNKAIRSGKVKKK